jgi:hypothetical protein
MKRFAAVVLLLLATPANADDIKLKKSREFPKGYTLKNVAVTGYDGKKVVFKNEGETNGSGASGFYAGRAESAPKPITLEILDRIEFDGIKDWANVTMKNGDFVRGNAESLKGGILRLQSVEKPIRMANVREIELTEEPKEPTPEPQP